MNRRSILGLGGRKGKKSEMKADAKKGPMNPHVERMEQKAEYECNVKRAASKAGGRCKGPEKEP